jgi:hypothetical protein
MTPRPAPPGPGKTVPDEPKHPEKPEPGEPTPQPRRPGTNVPEVIPVPSGPDVPGTRPSGPEMPRPRPPGPEVPVEPHLPGLDEPEAGA